MKNGQTVIYSILFLFMFVLYLASVSAAPSLSIVPSQDSHTSINNEYCGSQKPIQFTITNNNNVAGALCWYYTNKNPSPQKLTTSCIKASKTDSYSVYVPVPTSGSDTVSVQLECYDFNSFFQDKCIDSYSYEQAKANKASCAGASGKVDCDGTIAPRNFDTTCEALQFSVISSKSTLSLLSGQSETITITVTNQMSAQSISCNQNIGTLNAGSSGSYQLTITAPTGTGTKTETATVSCNSLSSGISTSKSANIIVNYQSDPCISALNDAQTTIADAQTQISNADKNVKEAFGIGADTTSAQASLTDAQGSLSTAQTQFSTAKNSCNGGDKTNGVTQANNAKSAALQAKTSATNAINTAQQVTTTFTQKQTEAKNKISDAQSRINASSIMVDKTEKALRNATELSSLLPSAVSGLDLVKHKARVDTAKAKLDQANNYVKEAQDAFYVKNFDSAQSKASTALQSASEANEAATDSYTAINTVLMTLGEGARSLLSASSEVSTADDTLSKMSSIIRYLEKKGVNLQEAKEIVTNGQQNIDSAKDLLSQSKNRLEAGMSDDAAQKAITARDKAAEPTNRLQRISSAISVKVEDAIEIEFGKTQTDIKVTEAAINAATETYGADSKYVIEAAKNIETTKNSLVDAKNAIEKLKGANDIQTLVTQGDIASKALEGITEKVQAANSNINAAKTARITKIGGITAAVIGALGGGLLYYRARKKKHKKLVHH